MTVTGDRRFDRAACDQVDLELVGRIRDGDLGALDPLYERHRSGCVHFARRLVAESDEEDVVSEAFLAMVGAIQRGRGPRRSVRAYLHQAIWTSSARRWQRRDEPADMVTSALRTSTRRPPSPDLERLDDRGELAPVMASLPAHWRRVLWLVEVEGRSMAEIGEELTIAPNAAAALTYRARKALRSAYLAASEPEPPNPGTFDAAA